MKYSNKEKAIMSEKVQQIFFDLDRLDRIKINLEDYVGKNITLTVDFNDGYFETVRMIDSSEDFIKSALVFMENGLKEQKKEILEKIYED